MPSDLPTPLIKRLTRDQIPAQRRNPVDKKALGIAEAIVEAVRTDGEAALRRHAEQFGELKPNAKLVYTRDGELKAAFEEISQEQREMLTRTVPPAGCSSPSQALFCSSTWGPVTLRTPTGDASAPGWQIWMMDGRELMPMPYLAYPRPLSMHTVVRSESRDFLKMSRHADGAAAAAAGAVPADDDPAA